MRRKPFFQKCPYKFQITCSRHFSGRGVGWLVFSTQRPPKVPLQPNFEQFEVLQNVEDMENIATKISIARIRFVKSRRRTFRDIAHKNRPTHFKRPFETFPQTKKNGTNQKRFPTSNTNHNQPTKKKQLVFGGHKMKGWSFSARMSHSVFISLEFEEIESTGRHRDVLGRGEGFGWCGKAKHRQQTPKTSVILTGYPMVSLYKNWQATRRCSCNFLSQPTTS